MGSHGPGRKRTTSKNGLTAEEDALNVIAREVKSSFKSNLKQCIGLKLTATSASNGKDESHMAQTNI